MAGDVVYGKVQQIGSPMKLAITAVLATALMLAACAEDDRSSSEPTTAERAAATTLIKQVRAIDGLPAQPADTPQLLSASTFAPVVSMLAPVGLSVTLPGRDHVGDLRPCITQTSDTVVYTDCEIAEHVIEGSVSGVDRRLKAELVDVFVLDPENHGAVTIKATLNNSDNSIDGKLEVDVMWTAAGADNTVDATVRADRVVLDNSGCAVGGSLTISGHIGDSGSSTRTLSFGPGCGDVRIQR